MPITDDQLDRLGGNTLFTTLDLASSHLQVPFIAPDGYYDYLYMPFGLCNASSVFQRHINIALGQLRFSVAVCYLDNILIPGKTFDDAMSAFKSVLKALQQGGLTLKLNKCAFLLPDVDFLGYRITRFGIRPGDAKLEVISHFPRSKDIHENMKISRSH